MQEHSEALPADDNLTTLRNNDLKEKRKKFAALQNEHSTFYDSVFRGHVAPAYSIRKYIRPNRAGTDRAVKEVGRVELVVHTPKSELRPASHDFIKGWFPNPSRPTQSAKTDLKEARKSSRNHMCTVPETIVPKNMMEEPHWLRYEIMGRLNGGDKAYIYPTIASDWVMLTGSQTRPVHEMWPNSTATASFPIKIPLPPAAKSQILFGFQLRGILSDTRGNLSSSGFRGNDPIALTGGAKTADAAFRICTVKKLTQGLIEVQQKTREEHDESQDSKDSMGRKMRLIKSREYVESLEKELVKKKNDPLENLEKYMALKELQDIYSSLLMMDV
ncbi:hypothetical protein EV421DRAFT_1737531 [Armillaria borealis]|uniref:Uncharacterized protein n=1 Tax=Armillaria borealis TaxID=47425 RepID=A0AA39JCC8_9AGAR|nr:hypothetical protein EV421DRAFT_1737531 [Armillaria borealis]